MGRGRGSARVGREKSGQRVNLIRIHYVHVWSCQKQFTNGENQILTIIFCVPPRSSTFLFRQAESSMIWRTLWTCKGAPVKCFPLWELPRSTESDSVCHPCMVIAQAILLLKRFPSRHYHGGEHGGLQTDRCCRSSWEFHRKTSAAGRETCWVWL